MSEASPPYDIEPADAVYLLAMLEDPTGLPERSNADLLNLLVQTLKLAESLSANCKEWLEVTAICHAHMHPYTAEKLNVPTLKGALSTAITVPRVDACGMCHTCAFRIGSQANQTQTVAEDVMDCLSDGRTFYCHDFPDGETPKVACRGFVAAMRLKGGASA